MTDARGGLLSAAVAAVTVLVLVVATWAATTGPDDLFRGDGATPDPMETAQPSETTSPAAPPEDPDREREDGGTPWLTVVLGVVMLAILGLLVAGGLWLLVVGLRSLGRMRWHRRPPRAAPPPPLDPVDAISAVAAAMADDAAAQLALLTGGTPRNAIVQCWHRFELQAARAGVPRQDWETPAEFTIRLFDLVEADAAAVGRLAALYREARFSEHEVGEEARTAALEALRRIHRDLRTLLSGGRR